MPIFTVYELSNEHPIAINALTIHEVVGFHSRLTGAKTRAQVTAWSDYGDQLEWSVGQEWYNEV